MSTKEQNSRRITSKQKRFLEIFPKKLCNVSQTCKAVNISRETFYRWNDTYDNFKKAIEEAKENTYDDLESKLFKLAMVDENPTICIFLAKTQMKNRGYVERQEVEHGGSDQFLDAMRAASKLRRIENGE